MGVPSIPLNNMRAARKGFVVNPYSTYRRQNISFNLGLNNV